MVSGFTRKRLNAKVPRHKGFDTDFTKERGLGRAMNAKAAKENNFNAEAQRRGENPEKI
jgi:hypothetical protein